MILVFQREHESEDITITEALSLDDHVIVIVIPYASMDKMELEVKWKILKKDVHSQGKVK